MRIDKGKLKYAADTALTLLVILGTLSLAWIGLTKTESIPVSAKPNAGETTIIQGDTVIVIDAGHGGFDGGATGVNTGVPEAGLNLEVAKLLEEKLKKCGFTVIMTRTDENALGSTKSEDMDARRRIMELDQVDICVSIHMNKFRDSTVSGPMVFYMRGSEEGKALAEHVMGNICELTGRPLRSANPEDLFVLRVPKAPSVLVECGFLSNAADEAKLMTGEYRNTLAEGIAQGIAEYLAAAKNGDT